MPLIELDSSKPVYIRPITEHVKKKGRQRVVMTSVGTQTELISVLIPNEPCNIKRLQVHQ